jgi:hypothetical protein
MDQHLHLGPSYLKQVEAHDFTRYFLLLPPGIRFEALFNPIFWAHHAKRLNPLDLIRVRAEDGSFDCYITVAEKTQGGAIMELWPKYPVDQQIGNDEVFQNNLVQAAIDNEIRPAQIEQAIGQSQARVEYKKAAGWRVIGVDGTEVSRQHPNKAAAELELAKHLAALGLGEEAA